MHVQNDGPPGDPDEAGTPGWELLFEPAEDEIVVRKDQGDIFHSNPGLADRLRRRQVDRVVVAGMQSEFCIQATSRGALKEGFAVLLPRGAHTTYDGETSAADVAEGVEKILEAEGVEVVNASAVQVV